MATPPSPRQAAALALLERGFKLIRLTAKVPIDTGWQTTRKGLSARQVLAWDGNFGVACGPDSGVTVIDIDPAASEEWHERAKAHKGPLVRTSRGWHIYFACREGLKNSVGTVAVGVDVRNKGGYAVAPGGILRPGDCKKNPNGGTYTWAGDGPLTPVPEEWIPKEPPRQRKEQAEPSTRNVDKWTRAALDAEIRNVAEAPPNTWNDSLNRAAFNLGQLIPNGYLTESEVRECLTAASLARGHEGKETEGTISSGLRAGMKTPRVKPERTKGPAKSTKGPPDAPVEAAPTTAGDLLVPGPHAGEPPFSVPPHVFTDRALARVPEGVFYARSSLLGEVLDHAWTPVSNERVRDLLGRHGIAHGVQWVWRGKQDEKEPVRCEVSITREVAALFTAGAPHSRRMRQLQSICQHPVVTRHGVVLEPGWHPEHGLLIEGCEIAPRGQGLPVWDLTVDFPLDDYGRAGILALLLTVLFRPTLGGNVPLFVVTAAQERVGKSKLLNDVIGWLLLGRHVPCGTWPEKEEEVRKLVFSSLVGGAEMFILDNVPRRLDSGPLASLVTAASVADRVLGQTKHLTVANLLTIIATGNHVMCSPELAKRSVVIEVLAACADPELRTQFVHKDLLEAVQKARPRVLRWLLDIVEAWAALPASDRPVVALGGFERWAETVGSIVRFAGLPLLEDRASRIEQMVESEDSMEDLAEEWIEKIGTCEWVRLERVLQVADGIRWGGEALDPLRSDRGRISTLGRVLGGAIGRMLKLESGVYTLSRRISKGVKEWSIWPRTVTAPPSGASE